MSFFGNLSTLFGTQKPGQPVRKNKQAVQRPGSDNTNKQTNKHGKNKGRSNSQQNQYNKKSGKHSKNRQPTQEPKQQLVIPDNIQQIRRDAEAKAREIIVEAKSEALQLRSKSEKEQRELSKKLQQQQQVLESKLDRIDERLEVISNKEDLLEKKRFEITELKQEVGKERDRVLKRLEKVSSLTKEEAKELLMSQLEKKLAKEMALFIRQKEEEAETEADEKVKEILIDAMKHGATDYVSEYTVSVVTLPSEDTKGKIIGKSGRNINAFERRTGVDVDLDMSPTEVRLSCFNPVRREIARIALERLVKDGRIQPTRIEEVVSKVEKEIAKVTLEAGKQLCHDVGVYNLPVELMRMLGKFKFRFSYGQNLIAHTLEETKIGIKIAHELGLNVNTVKLGCLLHDIGKVSEEEEGSHVELGIKIAKRFNLSQDVIDCIAQHHEDEPFSGPDQMAVYIADAISGARPGARYENYDAYVERLQKIEDIATGYKEVKQAYAIQAGREVRVLLEPEKSKDDDVKVLSLKIRDEIKNNVTYPGTVTVTVIREMRGTEIAK